MGTVETVTQVDPFEPLFAAARLDRAGQEEVAATRLIVFRLGADRFAVPVDDIAVILEVPAISPVPGTPAWVLGVANHRGDLLPVVDLAALLGLEQARPRSGAYLLVAVVDGVPTGVGCRVDQLDDVLAVASASIQAPLATVAPVRLPWVEGEIALDDQIVPVLRLRGLAERGGVGA